MAAACLLKEQGHAVTLIDLDPNWRVYGAGITITGPTLRAYEQLGLVGAIASEGTIRGGSKLFQADGTFIAELDEPPVQGGKPANGGIMRPVLHRIMQRRIEGLDIDIRLGLTVDQLSNIDTGVAVLFSDGTQDEFDLVVGSDGINSKVRTLGFPNAAKPMPTGQGCWRVSTALPDGVDCAEFYLGGKYPCGITPCGTESCYLWLLTPDDGTVRVTDEEAHAKLRLLLADFGGSAGIIRDMMSAEDWVNYRPLAAVLQPAPWVNGHIVLLGDAAHATTPHLASGAGMAVESAIVLAEEVAADRPLLASLNAYSERRYERCRFVIESSVAIGRAQLEGRTAEEVGQMIGDAIHQLSLPF